MRRYIFCYDISASSRRERVANCLSAYGERVQYSVFEICAEPKDYNHIVKKVRNLLDVKEDSLLVYALCPSCADGVLRLGDARENAPAIPDCIII